MMKLGIVGGMGPYATALFFAKLVLLTHAETDQEHIECIIHNAVQIPDRTAFITGQSSISPLEKLLEACLGIEKQVDIIAIPCMTSHHFYDDISDAVSVPVLDMQRIAAEGVGGLEVASGAREAREPGAFSVGIIATEGTVASGRLGRILSEYCITPVFPTRQDSVTKLIYGIKAGNLPGACVASATGVSSGADLAEMFCSVVSELEKQGASKVLLACSELQVFANMDFGKLKPALPIFDATELLALRCIEVCGGKEW